MASAARPPFGKPPPRKPFLRLGRRPVNRRVVTRRGPGLIRRTFGAIFRFIPRLFMMLATVAMVAGLLVGAYFGWEKLVSSPELRLRTVEVRGSSVRSNAAEIRAYANAPLDSPLLTIDLDEVAGRVRHHPWISSASVRRQLPDRLIIQVSEHVPSLLVSLGEMYVADEDGHLFKRFAVKDNLSLPVLTGLDRDEASKQLPRTTEKVRSVLGLVQAIDNHRRELGSLDEVHWDNDLGWSVVVHGGLTNATASLRVHLGKQPLPRLNLVLSTVRVLAEKHQTPAVIWADGAKNLYRVQVQLAQTRRGSHGTEG